jgi:dihydrofolate reductase
MAGMRLTITMFLTLDGIIQAPGAPDEDRRGGFTHGGWQAPYYDDLTGRTIAAWYRNADAFLLGRRTYEIFAAYWPQVTNPDDVIAARLNTKPKYVASRTLTTADWPTTTVLGDDLVDQVRRLKAQPGNELQVHGSGRLVGTLIEHGLIDEYRLLIYPLVLGSGQRLFTDSMLAALRLVDSKTTSTGALIATYVPAGDPSYGSFPLDER